MEGPTPVSALIHAATMITAGVFMVARFNLLFSMSETATRTPWPSPARSIFVWRPSPWPRTTSSGSSPIPRSASSGTCSWPAASAPTERECSTSHPCLLQGVAVPRGRESVMHAMSGGLKHSPMGGLKKYLPVTYSTFLIASLSIAGVPCLPGLSARTRSCRWPITRDRSERSHGHGNNRCGPHAFTASG